MPEDSPYDFVDDKKPAAPRAPEPPAEKRQEHICAHCGLKTYGKPRARCPDCAAPMDVLAADILQFSPTYWLRPISIGFLLIALAILLHLTAACLRNHLRGDYRATLHLFAAALMAFSVFKATAKDPDPAVPQPLYNTLSRFAALTSLLFWIPLAMIAWKIFFTVEHIKIFILLTIAAQGFLAFCLALYINALAVRVPNDSIASHAFNAGWIVAASCLMLMLVHTFNLISGDYIGASFFCAFPLIAGLVAVFLWAAITVLRIALDIRNAATAADSIAHRRAQRDAAAKLKKSPQQN